VLNGEQDPYQDPEPQVLTGVENQTADGSEIFFSLAESNIPGVGSIQIIQSIQPNVLHVSIQTSDITESWITAQMLLRPNGIASEISGRFNFRSKLRVLEVQCSMSY